MRRRQPPVEQVDYDPDAEAACWLTEQVRHCAAAALAWHGTVPTAPDGTPLEQWRLVVDTYRAEGWPLPMACPTGQRSQETLYAHWRDRLAAEGLPLLPPWDPRELLRTA